MAYFTPEFIQFFKQLAANNTRDWFHANKPRYESAVKNPIRKFAADMIQALKDSGMPIEMEAKDAIFRIARDTRFSNDKTPYKIHASAAFSPDGKKKDMQNPGLYVELSPEHCRVYSGIYAPDKTAIQTVRTKIIEELPEFKAAYSTPAFIETFGEIRGDKNKILPKDIKVHSAAEPLLFNKQWYWFSEYDAEWALQDNLIDSILHDFNACKEVRSFLSVL